MHIVILAHRVPYPPNKGEKLRTYHQLKFLVSAGYSISLLCPVESRREQKSADQLAEELRINTITVVKPSKLFRILKALVFNMSFSEAEFYSDKLATEFDRLTESANALMVTASSLVPYIDIDKISEQCLKIVDFMDVDSDKWSQYARATKWPFSIIYKREAKKVAELEQQGIEKFDTVFVISKKERELIYTSVPRTDKVKVLGNGIEHRVFAPPASKTKKGINLLFTGVMDYKPNIDAVHWFIDNCWEEIKIQVPNVTFTIAGMNPVASICSLDRDPQITVTGFVDNIMPFFDKAHIFVAPFQIARGVQNKILQAMSCALPVVTTHLGAQGIKSNVNEDIVVANTKEEFRDACIKLAKTDDFRAKLGYTARAHVMQHYSWDAVLIPLLQALSPENGNYQ